MYDLDRLRVEVWPQAEDVNDLVLDLVRLGKLVSDEGDLRSRWRRIDER
jgi:hypothetical protein